jgi:hypothetical protein
MGRQIQAAYDGIQLLDVPGIEGVEKFGRTTNVDASTPTDVWDGANSGVATVLHAPPTVARVHAITSGHADDTAAGPGAQAVTVWGLDASWNPLSEEVELAGAGSANTVGSYIRIFRSKVTRVGANGVATQNITITAAVDATITAAIMTPNNQTLMAIYTVPAGCRAFMTGYYATMNRGTPAATSLDVHLLVKEAADVATSPWQLRHVRGLFLTGTGSVYHPFNPYRVFPEKTDIKVQANDCNNADTDLSAGFGIILKAA